MLNNNTKITYTQQQNVTIEVNDRQLRVKIEKITRYLLEVL